MFTQHHSWLCDKLDLELLLLEFQLRSRKWFRALQAGAAQLQAALHWYSGYLSSLLRFSLAAVTEARATAEAPPDISLRGRHH
jgi:hypothetical protein